MQVHKSESLSVLAVASGKPERLGRSYLITRPGGRNTRLEFASADNPQGLTNEVLADVLIHRLEVLDGEQPCKENKAAIKALKQARADAQEAAVSPGDA